MGKSFQHRILVLIIIFSLAILVGHVHFHHHGDNEESQCPFCALLTVGLSLAIPFIPLLGLILFITIFDKSENKTYTVKFFNNHLRSPPFLSIIRFYNISKWGYLNVFKINEDIG